MKKEIIMGLLIAVMLSGFVFADDYSLPDWKDRYVNDFGGVFSAGQVGELRGLLMELESNTTAEFVVVSVGECAPFAPSQYANELFNKWGIGKEDKDNGLLTLYCKAENKIWVETGYGLEGILPDSKLGALLYEYII